MKLEYGVPVPRGVRKDWESSSVDKVSGGQVLRRYHVDPMWEDPERCVTWFDRFERMRVLVGHYPNGRSAVVRVDANGKWSTTFGRVAASGMSASGQDPQGLEAKPASPTAESGDAQPLSGVNP